MTTTHLPKVLRYLTLCEYKCATETISAEHYPNEDGSKYLLRITGGKHHGIEIHCSTEESVRKLFDTIVACRKANTPHPFLAVV